MRKSLDESLFLIKDYLSKMDIVDTVYLFGSALNDKFNKDSDIDIAILQNYISKENIDKLSVITDLSHLIDRDVDISFIDRVSPRFYHEILMNSKIIIDKNSKNRKNSEILNRKKYEDFIYLNKIYMSGMRSSCGK